MQPKLEVDLNSQVPVYKQLIQAIEDRSLRGEFKSGDLMPSMNELASNLQISKETVKKAYSILREKGIIESAQGKGFYISGKIHEKLRILMLFDRISTYKYVLYSSFAMNLSDISQITIHLHNQEVELFEYYIEENLNKYDYYIITPHFPLQPEIQKRVIKVLKKIPNRKLILLDRNIEDLPGNYGAVYQDFENDVADGLQQGLSVLRNFKKLNVISMAGSLYAPLLEKGISRFCTENSVDYEIHKNIKPNQIRRDEAFLILNGQLDNELIELVKLAKTEGCRIGKDIGIISYNESPINEIILDGLSVLSTDFKQMGELAAKMIIDKSFKKTRCDFRLIRRSTF